MWGKDLFGLFVNYRGYNFTEFCGVRFCIFVSVFEVRDLFWISNKFYLLIYSLFINYNLLIF